MGFHTRPSALVCKLSFRSRAHNEKMSVIIHVATDVKDKSTRNL